MSESRNRYVTLSLVAKTRDELSVMTIVAQTNWQMELQFFDFSQIKSGEYICWYAVPLSFWVERQSVEGLTIDG